MRVATIHHACWLASAGLTVSLSLDLWDFFAHGAAKRRPVDVDHVRAVLSEDPLVVQDVKEGLDYGRHVRPAFIHMNWTGVEAPPPLDPPHPELEPGPRVRPIAEVLWVGMAQEDLRDPGGSVAYVTFRSDGRETALRVGDGLPEPDELAVVHRIHGDGVEFSFRDGARANETVMVDVLEGDLLGGPRVPVDVFEIPAGRERVRERPVRTEEIAKNTFVLGREDVADFAENYATILTDVLRARDYLDADGRRTGIEIQRVRPGSLASRHGVMSGDVIISVNGHGVASQAEAIQFVKANPGCEAWVLKVLRLGREVTIVYVDRD